MPKRLTTILVITATGAIAGGFTVWLASYTLFYLVAIYPRREMEPMLAASLYCGDCLGWGITTLLLMVFGVVAGAMLGYKACKK